MIGLRELLLIGMVVLVLYGRTGVLKSRQAKTIMPWLSPVRRTTAGRVGAGIANGRGARETLENSRGVPDSGEPILLVRDDPGGDRRGRADHRPDPHHEGVPSRSLTLTLRGFLAAGKRRESPRCGLRTPSPLASPAALAPALDCALDMRTLLMMPFAFLQNIGTTELLIVAFVSLLVFGNRLPSVMRSLGKSVTEFKKGVSGIEDDIDQPVTADKKTTPPNP